MAIPDFQALMLPVLRASANGEVKISEVVGVLGRQLELTESELSELLPSGKQTTFANRVNWAKSYLGKAGLIDLTRRGHFVISDRGRTVLNSPPPSINIKFLETFPEFKLFREASDQPSDSTPVSVANLKDLTPDEIIRSAHAELDKTLSSELLAKVLARRAATSRYGLWRLCC
jgi:restriction system protein